MSEIAARCAPFEEDLSALLDEQLDATRAAEVRAHLGSCADCAQRLDTLRGVDTVLVRIAAAPISATRRARLRPVLTPAPPAHRAPPRRRRWIAPAALVATAAAAAALMLVLRPAPTAAPPRPAIAIAGHSPLASRADAELAAREMAAALDAPMGASAPPSAPVAPGAAVADSAAGGASPDLLDDASDEDLALATALHELPALDSPRDLEVVEQLDLLETLGALDAGGAGRG